MSRPKVSVKIDAYRYKHKEDSILLKFRVQFHHPTEGIVNKESPESFNDFVRAYGEPQVQTTIEIASSDRSKITEVPLYIIFDSYSKCVEIKHSNYEQFDNFSGVTLSIKRVENNSTPYAVFEKRIFDMATNITPRKVLLEEDVFELGFTDDLTITHNLNSTSISDAAYSYLRDEGVMRIQDTHVDDGLATMTQSNPSILKASTRVVVNRNRSEIKLPKYRHEISEDGSEMSSFEIKIINESQESLRITDHKSKFICNISAASGKNVIVTHIIVTRDAFYFRKEVMSKAS